MDIHEVFMGFGAAQARAPHHRCRRHGHGNERRGSALALQRINRFWGSARAGARLAR